MTTLYAYALDLVPEAFDNIRCSTCGSVLSLIATETTDPDEDSYHALPCASCVAHNVLSDNTDLTLPHDDCDSDYCGFHGRGDQ
jgi:hypothetical protein